MSRYSADMASGVARWAISSLENVLELASAGRLSTPYSAPYRVVHQSRTYALRHYGDGGQLDWGSRPPVLLIPPLMVTSEVFDIDPSVSCVQALMKRGLDVWLTDFGAPERQEGGMQRTLRDHVLAISETIDEIVTRTNRPVHLVGYSQGGMFAYQTAALRRSEGVASCVTLGSPVDFQGNFESIQAETVATFLRGAVALFRSGMDTAKGFSAGMTGGGFRALGISKQPGQAMSFLKRLHDRTALEQQERKRRFLRGEGFVGFPGPALDDVIDIVVGNTLAKGGLVIDGHTVSLVDITSPILYFVATHDTLVKRPLVTAVARAAPHAPCYESEVVAGHFGAVVGHTSAEHTWPTVADWVHWLEKGGDLPPQITNVRETAAELSAPASPPNQRVPIRARLLSSAAKAAASGLGALIRDAGKRADQVKWQASRVNRMQQLSGNARVSMGSLLEEQAAVTPDAPFFLWEGRAFTYEEVNDRVSRVTRGLIYCGVRTDERAAVLMKRRPSYLSAATALNRLGAVLVPLGAHATDEALTRALELAKVRYVIADPESVNRAKELTDAQVLVLGGGENRPPLPSGVIDMERINPDRVPLPEGYLPNARRGNELAMLLMAGGGVSGDARLARISNRRWAFSAFGAASLAALTPRDTVYCCTALDHPTGIMVSTGAALVSGARLALADHFRAGDFWQDVRRYGATVVFYCGEMGRELLNVPPTAEDRSHPIRLFCGSGMRADTWRKMRRRFGSVSVIETYGSTEGKAVLANVTGEKIGSIGRPIPGSAQTALVRYDFEAGDFETDQGGQLMPCGVDELGVLVSEVTRDMPVTLFEGYAEARPDQQRLIKGAFRSGDTWFNSHDVLRRDSGGDFWYVGSLSEMIQTAQGPVSTREIEEALCHLDSVCMATIWMDSDSSGELAGALSLMNGATLDTDQVTRVLSRFGENTRPVRLHVLDALPVTEGFRPLKGAAQLDLDHTRAELVYDAEEALYVRVKAIFVS